MRHERRYLHPRLGHVLSGLADSPLQQALGGRVAEVGASAGPAPVGDELHHALAAHLWLLERPAAPEGLPLKQVDCIEVSLDGLLHSRPVGVGCQAYAPAKPDIVLMSLAYAIALGQARSCLAALADAALDIYESSHFERLPIELDGLHPVGPALSPISGTKDELLARLEAAVDQMLDLGEGEGLELLLDSRRSARAASHVGRND